MVNTVTTPPELQATHCAICGTAGQATELWSANFDLSALTPTVFSARRLPDRIHFRMVRCEACGLVRSDPAVAAGVLADLYARSSFDYGAEVGNLQHTYGHLLKGLARLGAKPGLLLEIGGGNGFFLEEALRQGWEVRGVEPSVAAVESAAPEIRPHLTCGCQYKLGRLPALH